MSAKAQRVRPHRRLRPERAQRHAARGMSPTLRLSMHDVARHGEGWAQDRVAQHVARWRLAHPAAEVPQVLAAWSPDTRQYVVTIQTNGA